MAGVEEKEAVHATPLEVLHREAQARFNLVVGRLLRHAPNTKNTTHGMRTQFNNEYPTYREIAGDFKTSKVFAMYNVDHGTDPYYILRIQTPIVLDGYKPNSWEANDTHHPMDPHEVIEFRSRPFHNSLHINVRAVTKLGNFGHEVLVDQYTAGGLLPQIEITGRGKIRTIEAVTTLFKNVDLENPVYRKPFRHFMLTI